MNQIKISAEQLKKSDLLSHKSSRIELRKVGAVTFALRDTKTSKILFGFASSALANFTTENSELKIFDIELVRQEVIHGLLDSRLVLILKLHAGSMILLDEYDHICTTSPYCVYRSSSSPAFPYKIWDLPEDGYLARMLLTERMVKHLKSLADESQIEHLLHILWRDYDLARNPEKPQSHLSIEGEFIVFTTAEFAFGSVIFDCA